MQKIKKLFLILFVCVFGLGLTNIYVVNAEEVVEEEVIEEEIVEEVVEEEKEITSTDQLVNDVISILQENGLLKESTILENEIIKYILTGVACVFGVFLLYLTFKKKLNSICETLGINIDKSDTKNEELKTTVTEALKSLNLSKEQIDKVTEIVVELNTATNNYIEKLDSEYRELKSKNETILEILKVYILNNSEIVEKGLASKVKEIFNNEENNETKD